MNVITTALPDVLLIKPNIWRDTRGFFMESFNAREWERLTGRQDTFVQDNHSSSVKHTLRGLHYQLACPQAKLVRVIHGEIFDVAVDLRRSSSSFGLWVGQHLSAKNYHQLFIPEGFAHGFLTLSDEAEVIYKVTTYFEPEAERRIVWNDKTLAIDWPLEGLPILSEQDHQARSFQESQYF